MFIFAWFSTNVLKEPVKKKKSKYDHVNFCHYSICSLFSKIVL